MLAFAAFQLAFPYITYALVMGLGCNATPGACGVVAAMIPMALKPIALLALCACLASLCVRRSRGLGLPAWAGLVVPLLISFDWQTFAVFGSHWGYAMSNGILGVAIPIHAAAALALLFAMMIYPQSIFRLALRGASGAAALVGLASIALLLVDGVWTAAFSGRLARGLPFNLQTWALAGLLVSLVALYVLLAGRRDEAQSKPARPDPVGSLFVRSFGGAPWWVLFPLALLLATGAFAYATEQDAGDAFFWFPLSLVSTILPTALCYLLALVAAWHLVVRHTRLSVLLVVLALLPFAHWAYLRQAVQWEAERETAEVRAVQTYRPAVLPAALVFEGDQGNWRQFAEFASIESVYTGRPGDYRRFDLAEGEEAGRDPVGVEALPAEYLVLRTGRFSNYQELGRGHGGPFELAYVSPQGEQLVALRYYALKPSPAALPVLTPGGWLSAPDIVRSVGLDARIEAFVQTALTEGQSAL